MFESAALPFAASFLLSLLLVPVAMRLAPHLGYVDLPKRDRAHVNPTPRFGGAAVVCAVAGATAPWAPEIPRAIYAGGAVAVVLGLVDDRRPLPPIAKLAGQAAAAALLVLPAWGTWGPWVCAAAIFWTMTLFNATNFLDNQDAALSSAALPGALALGVMGLMAGSAPAAAGGFALAGALAGFLRFNKPPAAVFLGDIGSLAVGYVLAALTLVLAERAGRFPQALAPAFAVAYPLFDLLFVTATRIASGRRIDVGGVDHTSHRLARAFDSVGRAAVAIGAVSLVFAVTAVARSQSASWGSFALTLAVGVAFFAWVAFSLLRREG